MKMIRTILAVLAVILTVAVAVTGLTGKALADEPDAYTGVDFVFLIDQSGSMCGAACNSSIPTQNDPQGFRFEGPRFAIIDFLGDQMSEIYVSSTARISIIEFGQDVNLEQYRAGENIQYENIAINEVLPPTTIESDRNAWQIQREQLLQRMTDYQATRETQNLGNTDHLGAIQRAIQVLDQMQASDPSKRLKVIVLLTDGQPAVCYPQGPQDNPWADQQCLGPGQILPQIEREMATRLAGEDYLFYVVGMNDAASDYWTNTGPFWESLATRYNGEARAVQSQNEVAQFMGEIVNTALARLHLPPEGPGVISEWLPQLGTFPVRPYLQSLTFYIIRTSPTDTVGIFNPQGVPLPLDLADGECQDGVCFYALGRLIDKVVVARPEPGMWRAEATIPAAENVYDTVRIGTRSLLFAPQLVEPAGERYAAGVPLTIQIAMLDLDGQTVPRYEDSLYALDSRALVITSEGQQMAETALDPQTFSGQVVVSQPGEAFQIHLVGTTHAPNGDEFQVLDHTLEGSFAIERLAGEFVPPGGLYEKEEATLNYQVDLSGFQPLADGYHYTGQFELSHPDFAAPVIIQAEDADGDGVFSARYKPEANGTYGLDFKLFVVNEATGEQFSVPLEVKQDSAQSFDVGLTKGLELVLKQPANGSRQVKRNWLLQIVPLEIEAALIETESGQPVDWTEARASDTDTTLSIDVRDPAGQSRGAELQPAEAEPGSIRLVGKGFAQSGDWTITLPQDLNLKTGFALVNTSPTVTITRVENYAALAVWSIVLVGLLGIVVWQIGRARSRSSGPHMVGYLEILDENDIPLAGGVISLPPRVNQHTFTNLPSSTGIRKLQVRYVSEDAVEVTVDGVPTTIVHETEWDSGRDFKIRYVNPTID
ncbi:MAG: hypothetical protein Kow0063_16100 [Anaerolineae bacterium]